MDATRHREAIGVEGRALARAATGRLDRPVPSCPGWTVATLVEHVGRAYRWVAAIVRTRADADVDTTHLPVPTGPDLLPWYDETLAALLDLLAAEAPATPVWNWSGQDLTVAFWARRMAHETAVHRWDAEAATVAPQPIQAELAADGVQEMLDVIVPYSLAQTPVEGLAGTVHVHCTDTDGEWLLMLRPDSSDVRREHAKADLALRGTASDLLLALWGRTPPGSVERFGDVTLLTRLLEV